MNMTKQHREEYYESTVSKDKEEPTDSKDRGDLDIILDSINNIHNDVKLSYQFLCDIESDLYGNVAEKSMSDGKEISPESGQGKISKIFQRLEELNNTVYRLSEKARDLDKL